MSLERIKLIIEEQKDKRETRSISAIALRERASRYNIAFPEIASAGRMQYEIWIQAKTFGLSPGIHIRSKSEPRSARKTSIGLRFFNA